MNTPLPYTDQITIQLAIATAIMPFAAFVLNIFFVKAQSKLSGWLSAVAILASFVLALIVFGHVWNHAELHVQQTWFTIGSTSVGFGVWLNNLSVLMLLLVTAIALPVHIYSIAYMKGDDKYTRYFAYLSFFCFAMLALVIVDSLILLYAFWELVGFASYLLIGFWYTRHKAIQANKKAFIMNRIGDVGLLIGVMMVFGHYHTFDLVQLFGSKAPLTGVHTDTAFLTITGICLLMGAIAKSAQFPLHTWLPDAMEGPTSVSALIHAATMVAAGIFLLGRVYSLFTPDVLTLIATIGCFTAFMAASIALTQNDLKRILAYSTISQLGFMMIGMGVGAYSSALLHLATHAFFKCLLFLVAGVIIHEVQHIKEHHQLDIDPQDINNMGGLRKSMPLTFITCVIASLALTGFPLTSGCLSKDGILVQAFYWAEGKGPVALLIPVTALLTSLLTIFYIARLVFKVFLGQPRLKPGDANIVDHAHDGSVLFKIPMVFLALCSLFPLFSANPFEYDDSWLYRGFHIVVAAAGSVNYHMLVLLLINLLALPLIWLAYTLYVKQSFKLGQSGLLFKISYNQWYIDRFYQRVVVKYVMAFCRKALWFDKNIVDGVIHLFAIICVFIGKLSAWSDKYIVDGFLTLLTVIVKQAGNFVRRFQTGKVQTYILTMLLLVLVIYALKTLI